MGCFGIIRPFQVSPWMLNITSLSPTPHRKGGLDYYIIVGPEPQTIANTYARLTGFTPLPPKWTLGYHHSRYGWQSQEEILGIAEELRSQNFPCDVLYFDIDYMDQLHIFTWDQTTFPDPLQMNTTLKNQGFKSINIMEPLLLTTDPLWSEADTAGYFLQDTTGNSVANDIWYGHVSWVDFTKDAAADWYRSHLMTFLASGIDGLWNDLNEPAQNFMAEAIYNFNGDPRFDLEARNLYALYHTKTSREAMTQLRPNIRPWNFARSGTSGIQRYACTWSGDTTTSFDSLRVSIQISIHMGLSGQNQFGHDIGGFLGDPSPELFIRWLEFSAFTPLFRNHSVNTALPREPWVYGEPYTSIIREIIETRYRWLPYLYTLFEEASRTASPVLCPTFFYTPDDPETYNQDSEFLLGKNLLVAPVYIEGATERTLYLPTGSQWYDYETDQLYEGGTDITVPAPLEMIPLFVRAGAILPTGPVIQYVNSSIEPPLNIDIYPGPDQDFTLYEDDGVTLNYQQGEYLRTRLSHRQETVQTLFNIESIEGLLLPGIRSWNLTFHAIPEEPENIHINGELLSKSHHKNSSEIQQSGWDYDSENRLLLIQIEETSENVNLVITKKTSGSGYWILH